MQEVSKTNTGGIKMTNMDLWNKVCETDPANTKKMTHGAKLTAICAQSQVKAATEAFGPLGVGWGFDYTTSYPCNDTLTVKLTFWHGKRENTFCQSGGCDLFSYDKKGDNDAEKKAVTDAMTKCLSLLGFNSDVFEGKFDDNKYVQEQKQKYEAKKTEVPKTKLEKQSKDFHRDIDSFEDVSELQSLWESLGFRNWYHAVEKRFPEWHKENNSMDAHKEKRKEQLQQKGNGTQAHQNQDGAGGGNDGLAS